MKSHKKGLFITFEGGEGSGKSTQIQKLGTFLKKKGYKVVLTREPGGTLIGEKIRNLLLHAKHQKMSVMTELFLYIAARTQHVEEKIRPALTKGYVVLCDRYADATTAYQGAARKLPANILSELHAIGTNNLIPDLTFLLDLPASTGRKRMLQRNKGDVKKLDRLEREKKSFHERVRRGYLTLAKKNKKRIKMLDATRPAENIFQEIIGYIEKWMSS